VLRGKLVMEASFGFQFGIDLSLVGIVISESRRDLRQRHVAPIGRDFFRTWPVLCQIPILRAEIPVPSIQGLPPQTPGRCQIKLSISTAIASKYSPYPYSGSGRPFVSGANGSAARPTRNTRHMVTPA